MCRSSRARKSSRPANRRSHNCWRATGNSVHRQRRHGSNSGVFIRGASEQSVDRADRWATNRLGDHRQPGAVAHSAGPDRTHRNPARPGVVAVRCRCHRRRDPDLHAARRGAAARERQHRLWLLQARPTPPSASSGGTDLVSYSVQAGYHATHGWFQRRFTTSKKQFYNPDQRWLLQQEPERQFCRPPGQRARKSG
jgi:hypothetical protein